jgi:hypothetical protein
MVPLLIVNGAAVYGQIAYAYAKIAPPDWATGYRLALSVLFAAAVESIAVYVGWHAHDALLQRAHATAARLRRASYLIAVAVAGINYAHFAGPRMVPTAAAVAFGLLSFLSPWLWGLHTRRTQHVQLLAEDAALIDDGGAEFSAERRRAFPIRSFMARRWSIDHNIRDPRAAWDGYNTARQARLTGYPTGRVRTAWAALRGTLTVSPTTPTTPTTPSGPADAPAPAAGTSARPVKTHTAPRTATVKTPTPQRVATAVRKTPDATPAQIAARIGVSERTVQRYWPHPSGTTGELPAAA